MTTFDKSSSAEKSFKQVVNGLNAAPSKSLTTPAERALKNERDILALKAKSLQQNSQNQDSKQEQFEADAAFVIESMAIAWTPAAQPTDVLLAQADANDGARTASDAAGGNSAMKNIDWGVASNTPPAASSLGTLGSAGALLGGLLVAGLGGGGGSKSDTKATADTTLKLSVQDGLIAGAKVYRDVKDEQHLVGTTDANGQLVLSKALTGSGVLIAVGGTNIDTKLANTIDLKIAFTSGINASSVMSPVTTLVSALLASGASPNLAAAETTVKQLLGLSAQLNLSNYDPMDAANVGSADALALRKAGAQIVQLAAQLPDADQFFTTLAQQVSGANTWKGLVQNENFVNAVLASQLTQLSVEQRATLSASIVQDLTALGSVSSAGQLSAAQLNAAQLSVELLQDTGSDGPTRSDHITTNAQLDIRGYNTGAGYDKIEISLDHGKTWVAYNQAHFTPNDGAQDITVMVRQAGLAATQSDELSFTWVSQSAHAPQLSLTHDTGTSGSDGITSNPQITLGLANNPVIVVGNQSFQARLEYSLNGADYQPIPEGGLFNGLQAALSDGHYDLKVRAYYPGLALESDPSRLSFTLDTEATAPQGYAITGLGSDTQDPDTTDRVFSAQGASSVLFTLNQAPEAGATVTLHIEGKDYAVQANDQGIWQAHIPVADLTSGTYTPHISIVDAAGNANEADMPSFTVDNQAFVLNVLATPEQVATLAPESDSFMQDNVTNVNLPVFEGTAEKGALITLSIDGNTIGTGRADDTGAWRIAATAVLEDGIYTPVVTVTDLAGNVSPEFEGASFTVVTTKPESSHVVLADVNPTTDETLLALMDGVFDPASLSAPYSESAALTAAGITFELNSLDTGASNSDGITMFPMPRITGTVSADSGAGDLLVFVTLKDVSTGVDQTDPVKFAPIIAVDGEWSVQVKQPLGADGETHTYVPYITVMDGAGNITRTTGDQIVIDRQAPDMATVGLVHDEESDTGFDHADGITSNATPWLQGTAESGSTVVVDVAADGSLVFTTTTGSDGHWSVHLDSLSDGTYTPQVTVIDLAGNVSAVFEAEQNFTVDTTPPEPPEVTAFSEIEGNDTGADTTDHVTGNNTPTIAGTAEPGATVTVTVGDWVSEAVPVGEDGTWSVTTDALPDGSYQASVVVEDAAGNKAEPVQGESFTVLTTPPDASALTVSLVHDSASDTGVSAEDGITNNPTPDIEGTAPAGMRVVVVVNDVTYGQDGSEIYADGDGHWSVTLSELPEGDFTAVAHLVDAVGNESATVESSPFTVDMTAPELPLSLDPKIVYINTPMNYQPDGGSDAHVVSMTDATGNLPEGLTIDEQGNLTGMTEVAGYTWLSAVMADVAGNPVAHDVYQPLIFVSDIRPNTQTINHTSAAAAKFYQGTAGNDANWVLYNAPGDVLLTKDGNDTVTVSNANGMKFAYVDGGAGIDAMKFTVADMAMDFSQFNNPTTGQLMKNFEIFQFTGKNASVNISAADIFGLSSPVSDADYTYSLRIDGASGSQSASIADLDASMKTVNDEDVFETYDATGTQSNSGKYHLYTGDYTDGLDLVRHVSLLIDKNFVV